MRISKENIKRFIALAMMLVMMFTVVACGSSSQETTSTSSESTSSSSEASSETTTPDEIPVSDVLKVGLNGDAPTLDPLMSTGAIVRDVNKYIFEGLFELDEDLAPSLQLAESYSHNDEYTSYEFVLRQGVMFHNGKEMTSEDVVASLNRWLSKNGAIKSIITHGEQFEAVDTYTVKIDLEAPCYLLPSIMVAPAQFPAIMPVEVIEAATDEQGIQEYIGTGPMTFVEWKQNQYVLLALNEDYVGPGYPMTGEAGDKEIYYKEVYLYFVTDPTIRSAGIQSGEYDIVSNVSYDDVTMLEANPMVKLDKSLMGYATVIMNKVNLTLGTNEKLREAITIGLDNAEIMNAAYPASDYYEITSSMMPPDSIWYSLEGTENINKNDVETAKQMIIDAGYDGTPLKVITDSTYSQHYNSTLVIVQQLEELGFNVDLQVVDWATMLQYKRTQGAYDIYFMDYPVVTAPVSLRTISQTDEGWTIWPEFLELLADVNMSTSDDTAIANWVEVQKYVLGRSSYVPLGYSYYCNATSDAVQNYHSMQCQSIYGSYMTN